MSEIKEYCDHHGAMILKHRIEKYWSERGYAVTVSLHEAGFTSSMRTARYDVRSSLRDGLPSPAAKLQRAA